MEARTDNDVAAAKGADVYRDPLTDLMWGVMRVLLPTDELRRDSILYIRSPSKSR